MSKDDNEEVLAMARAFHESIKDAEELYQALKAENERLREALDDLLDNCTEQAFGHKQAVARAKQLLSIEAVTTGGEE